MYRDIHILTVGTYTYTTDQRFQTAYHRQTNEWTMQIKWAQKRDAGMYGWYLPSVILALLRIHLSIKTHFLFVNSNFRMSDINDTNQEFFGAAECSRYVF